MKDIYKNPVLYYVLVPVVIALWPLSIWGVYLSEAENTWKDEKAKYIEAQLIIEEILHLDPDRMDFAEAGKDAKEFDYAVVVEQVASLCRIVPENYKLSSGLPTTSSGQKSQSAKVDLIDVDIKRFADFFSAIQLRWANLQCTKLTLTKKKDAPDKWDVDLRFKYFF